MLALPQAKNLFLFLVRSVKKIWDKKKAAFLPSATRITRQKIKRVRLYHYII